jgi:aerobic carbon-monoxide dehydrogenase medium subunit
MPVTLTQFDYLAPVELEDAISALQQPGSVALAGGHHLLTRLKRRELAAARLVDLRGVRELGGLEADAAGTLRIGAMTTLTELLAYLRDRGERGSDALTDAISMLGDRQSRNRVTLGGQLAAGRIGNDLAAALMVFGATVQLAGAQGLRSVPLTDLWGSGSRLELRAGELIAAVSLEPALGGSGFARMTNRATLEAVCGVAAAVTSAPDGRVEHCRIAAVGAMARPGRMAEMEKWALTGARSGELAPPPADAPFVNDHLASADYRRYMTRVLAGRALALAIGRAAR